MVVLLVVRNKECWGREDRGNRMKIYRTKRSGINRIVAFLQNSAVLCVLSEGFYMQLNEG